MTAVPKRQPYLANAAHQSTKQTQNTSHQEKLFLMTQIQELISQMTLEEKAALCSGLDFWYTKPIDRLGIPSIMVADDVHKQSMA